MVRLLLSRRWLVWMLAALIAAVACLFLGRWQWNRWESRHEMQSTIRTNYDATPVDWRMVMPEPSSTVGPKSQWRQVRVSGRYVPQGQTLVRNRPNDDGTFGYEVLVPFRTSHGNSVLIDRGWVPNGPSADTPPQIPLAPDGKVIVTGWVRPAEPSRGRAEVPGQISSIAPKELGEATGRRTDRYAYLLMGSESPAPAQRPRAFSKPDLGTAAGVNLSYAFQWWGAMIAFPALVVLAARRELPSTGKKTPKPKKTRIWDEEDG